MAFVKDMHHVQIYSLPLGCLACHLPLPLSERFHLLSLHVAFFFASVCVWSLVFFTTFVNFALGVGHFTQNCFCRGGEPMMVVSLDGGLHAIHPVSQKRLWSFESGAKLATAYYANGRKEPKESRDSNASMDVPRDEDLAGDSGDPGEEWTVFPGPDGSLYVHDENGITVSGCNI